VGRRLRRGLYNLQTVKGPIQTRRFQIFVVAVVMVCLLALLIPHAGGHGTFFACVLFFPVFLFGLLDLADIFRNAACADEFSLPSVPVLSALFERPPPLLR
jgi:hypothetical protein